MALILSRPYVVLPVVNALAAWWYLSRDPLWRDPERLGWARVAFSFYLSAIGMAATYFFVLSAVPRRRAIVWCAAATLASFVALCHLFHIGYFEAGFQGVITVSVLDFARQHPSYTWTLFREHFTWPLFLGGCAIVGGFTWYLARAIASAPARGGWKSLAAALAIAVVAGNLTTHPNQALDQCVARAGWRSLFGEGTLNVTFAPNRVRLPPLRADRPFNVVVFRLESITRDAVSLYDPKLPTTPFWAGMQRARPDELFLAPRHFTNSAATDVSVMLLYSGAGADSPQTVHRRTPLLWSYLKAAGYNTSVFKTYALNWGAFDIRFQERMGETLLDETYQLRNAPQLATYENCINDEKIVDAALYYQDRRGWKGPFLQIVNMNMPHFLGKGAGINGIRSLDDQLDRRQLPLRNYYNAIYYDDQLMQRYLEAMPAEVRDQTVFLVVSDHGDDVLNRQQRLENYFHECAEVPCWLYLPQAVQKRLPADAVEQLRRNLASVATQNTDLLPTLLDLLGLRDEPAVAAALADLPGQSLLRPTKPPEWSLMLNTNALRRWDREGFGLTMDNGTKRYVYNMGEEYFFDLASDPRETQNLVADSEAAADLDRVRRYVLKNPELLRIVSRYGYNSLAADSALARGAGE